MTVAENTELDLDLADAVDVANRYIELGTSVKGSLVGRRDFAISEIVQKLEVVPGRENVVVVVHQPREKISDDLIGFDLLLTYNKIMDVFQNAGWVLFPAKAPEKDGEDGRECCQVFMEAMRLDKIEGILDNLDS